MATPQPIYNGSMCEHDPDENRSLRVKDLDPVERSRISVYDPQYQQSRKSGPTDLDLLPSQRLRMQDIDARVQPTDNLYHWESAQSRSSNVSAWVKASWTRTNEIIRQRAGTLNRKAAVRRSRNDGQSPKADGINSLASHGRAVMGTTTHRSFSFEHEKRREDLSASVEETDDEDALLDTITRVDSGAVPPSAGRTTRCLEELDGRPCIARTFSEILGSETFVPTALIEEK
jgi:hypothetical protein